MASLLVPGQASAKRDQAAYAEALVEEAWELRQAGRFTEAISRLEEAYGLFPVAVLAYNLGRTHEEAGSTATARDWYETVLTLEAPADVAQKTRKGLARLAAREAEEAEAVARAEVDSADDGATEAASEAEAVVATIETEDEAAGDAGARDERNEAWRFELDVSLGEGGLWLDGAAHREGVLFLFTPGARWRFLRPELGLAFSVEKPVAPRVAPGLRFLLFDLLQARVAATVLLDPLVSAGLTVGAGLRWGAASWWLTGELSSTWWPAEPHVFTLDGNLGVGHAF